MKGYLVVSAGHIFQATKPQALSLLKEIANGGQVVDEKAVVADLKDLGPITVELSGLDSESARDLFADISLGKK